MRLCKARIENFLILKEADVPLDAKALVLVLGYTSDGGRADSNGVGKSSLFEAVCWCLYGKTYKGISHDDVVNNRCKGGTRVELDLLIDSDAITVVRHRKHSKYKNKLLLFKNGVNITPFNQKDAEVVLDSLLPLSYNAFKHVCYFGQGMSDKFLALNDSGRKQLLEELLGMEAYNAAEKRVKLELRELRDDELRQRQIGRRALSRSRRSVSV
jgi:DNA repair exonuclease SbcCD ATPase subunit